MSFRSMLNKVSATLGKSQNKDAASSNTNGAAPAAASSSNSSTQAKVLDAGMKYFGKKSSHGSSSKSTEAKVIDAGLNYLSQQQQKPPANNANGAAPAAGSSGNALDPKNLINMGSKLFGSKK
ncbi:hypothetical protein GGH91_002668 [Coemansia sp. RSA 2671]|nr:hypothetical protein GGH91_002668 [Coemansia sp. RSA 2671]